MDFKGLVEGADAFIHSGMGFVVLWAAFAAFFMWLASRFNPFQESWKAWEGSIITGIKLAEKQIPDDTSNAGLAKLDTALRFVLKAYADANNGKEPSARIIEDLKQGIQITHADLDRFGGLSRKKEFMV